MITFESLDVRKFVFTLPIYLHGIQVRFIYEGHRVKVTGARRSEMPVPAVIGFDGQFSSVLARWQHRSRAAGGRALD